MISLALGTLLLSWAEFWYNTTFHASTKMTPFKAVYGRDPPPLIRSGAQSTSVASLEQKLQERDAILDELEVPFDTGSNQNEVSS